MYTSQNNKEFPDIWECGYCGFECNPESQICLSCANDLSIMNNSFRLTEYKKIYYEATCDGCDTNKNLIIMSEIKGYEDSPYCYCKICFQKQKNQCVVGYTCSNGDDLQYICPYCKCDEKKS